MPPRQVNPAVPAGPRGDHPQVPGQEPGQPLPVGRGPARRPAPLPRGQPHPGRAGDGPAGARPAAPPACMAATTAIAASPPHPGRRPRVRRRRRLRRRAPPQLRARSSPCSSSCCCCSPGCCSSSPARSASATTTTTSRQVEVPNVIGETLDDATAHARGPRLRGHGHRRGRTTTFDDGRRVRPGPRRRRRRSTRAARSRSRSAPAARRSPVPDVIGEQLEDAAGRRSRPTGFTVRVESRERRRRAEENEVVDQDPAPQAEAPTGSRGHARSWPAGPSRRRGPRRAPAAPRATRRTCSRHDGFEVVQHHRGVDDTVAEGRVIRTEPPAGTSRPQGSTVTHRRVERPEQQDETVPSVDRPQRGQRHRGARGRGLRRRRRRSRRSSTRPTTARWSTRTPTAARRARAAAPSRSRSARSIGTDDDGGE